MHAIGQIGEILERLRDTGELAWVSTLSLLAITVLTQLGVRYALKHQVPNVVRGILEGLSNRDLPTRK